jgi:hypothetical protein
MVSFMLRLFYFQGKSALCHLERSLVVPKYVDSVEKTKTSCPFKETNLRSTVVQLIG